MADDATGENLSEQMGRAYDENRERIDEWEEHGAPDETCYRIARAKEEVLVRWLPGAEKLESELADLRAVIAWIEEWHVVTITIESSSYVAVNAEDVAGTLPDEGGYGSSVLGALRAAADLDEQSGSDGDADVPGAGDLGIATENERLGGA